MIGRILPITAIIVPFWLVRAMVSWSETFEVLPAILVVEARSPPRNGSGPITWIATWWTSRAGVVSLIATMLFLRVWQPKRIWRFEDERQEDAAKVGTQRSGRRLHRRADSQGLAALCDSLRPSCCSGDCLA